MNTKQKAQIDLFNMEALTAPTVAGHYFVLDPEGPSLTVNTVEDGHTPRAIWAGEEISLGLAPDYIPDYFIYNRQGERCEQLEKKLLSPIAEKLEELLEELTRVDDAWTGCYTYSTTERAKELLLEIEEALDQQREYYWELYPVFEDAAECLDDEELEAEIAREGAVAAEMELSDAYYLNKEEYIEDRVRAVQDQQRDIYSNAAYKAAQLLECAAGRSGAFAVTEDMREQLNKKAAERVEQEQAEDECRVWHADLKMISMELAEEQLALTLAAQTEKELAKERADEEGARRVLEAGLKAERTRRDFERFIAQNEAEKALLSALEEGSVVK